MRNREGSFPKPTSRLRLGSSILRLLFAEFNNFSTTESCAGSAEGETFDLSTLSQRLAPDSYISFGTVLARDLIIGTSPDRHIVAVKTGRPRRYAFDGYVIEHVSVNEDLLFGFSNVNGVRYADAEKALLDTLYFHLRGRRYPFDIYSDISLGKFKQERIRDYLSCYQNPKFVAFVQGILEDQ